MELFDKIGTKISNAGQEVTTQTKTQIETVKMNSEISANDKLIVELYQKIGKQVYEENSNNVECSSYEDIQKIEQLKERNDSLTQMINNLKGMSTCNQCGNSISSKGAFCNFCGAPVAKKIVARSANQCVNCGADVEEGDIFCFKCGTKVELNVQKAIEEPKVENKCLNCNSILVEGTKFCNKCGTRVGA